MIGSWTRGGLPGRRFLRCFMGVYVIQKFGLISIGRAKFRPSGAASADGSLPFLTHIVLPSAIHGVIIHLERQHTDDLVGIRLIPSDGPHGKGKWTGEYIVTKRQDTKNSVRLSP